MLHSIGYDISPFQADLTAFHLEFNPWLASHQYQHPIGQVATLKATDAMPKPIEVPKTREPSSQQHIQVCWAPGKDEKHRSTAFKADLKTQRSSYFLMFKDFSSNFRSLRLATNPHQPLSYLLWKIMETTAQKWHRGKPVSDNRYSWTKSCTSLRVSCETGDG